MIAAVAVGFFLSACDTAEPVAEATPTYHTDIAPLVARSCTACHYEGGIGPFSLEDYDDALKIKMHVESWTAAGA